MSETEAKIDEMIRRLEDFRARSDAKRALVKIGTDAVEALIKALGHPKEGVRWTAASALGEIGDKRALPALNKIKSEAGMSQVATTASDMINARGDVGAVADVGEGVSQAAATMDVKDMVIGIAKKQNFKLKEFEGGYEFQVPLSDERHQDIKIILSKKDSDGEEMVVAYTECGPAKEKNFRWALEQNMKMPYGAIAIREVKGEPNFVMLNTILKESLTKEQLRKSIFSLAKRGDRLEKALTQEDLR